VKVYLDSSVILRLVLGQRGRLKAWRRIREPIASALVEVECLRTLDRFGLREGIGDEALAVRRASVFELLDEAGIIEPTGPILARASQPLPVPLGTLGAIHLATALLWRERGAADLVMATHDESLALAARACGLRVVGT
jgi:predicted nucleic acid-binding protein